MELILIIKQLQLCKTLRVMNPTAEKSAKYVVEVGEEGYYPQGFFLRI